MGIKQERKADVEQYKENRAVENTSAIKSVCNAFELPLLTLSRQHHSMFQKQEKLLRFNENKSLA